MQRLLRHKTSAVKLCSVLEWPAYFLSPAGRLGTLSPGPTGAKGSHRWCRGRKGGVWTTGLVGWGRGGDKASAGCRAIRKCSLENATEDIPKVGGRAWSRMRLRRSPGEDKNHFQRYDGNSPITPQNTACRKPAAVQTSRRPKCNVTSAA